MSFRKIFILGAGAIGSIYGAFLSRKNDVTLIGNKAHVETINLCGLRITGDATGTFRVKADTKIKEVPDKVLVILTTKAYDSATAVERVKGLLKKDTIILILQNGLGNEEKVRHVVGDRVEILRGVTKMAAEFTKPGEIRFWSGETVIEASEVSSKIAKILNECGLTTRLSANIKEDVWTKLVVNCVVNPLTALFRVRNSAIWVDSLKTVRHGIVNECAEVAEAEGIALPASLAERIDKRLASYTNFSSMYQDLSRGNRTEIDFLNGRIVELAKRHHIDVPLNATLVSFIRFLEAEDGIPRKD